MGGCPRAGSGRGLSQLIISIGGCCGSLVSFDLRMKVAARGRMESAKGGAGGRGDSDKLSAGRSR